MSDCYEFIYTIGSNYIGDWCNNCEHHDTCGHLEEKKRKASERKEIERLDAELHELYSSGKTMKNDIVYELSIKLGRLLKDV